MCACEIQWRWTIANPSGPLSKPVPPWKPNNSKEKDGTSSTRPHGPQVIYWWYSVIIDSVDITMSASDVLSADCKYLSLLKRHYAKAHTGLTNLPNFILPKIFSYMLQLPKFPIGKVSLYTVYVTLYTLKMHPNLILFSQPLYIVKDNDSDCGMLL